jgi:hypothetical protein
MTLDQLQEHFMQLAFRSGYLRAMRSTAVDFATYQLEMDTIIKAATARYAEGARAGFEDAPEDVQAKRRADQSWQSYEDPHRELPRVQFGDGDGGYR